MTEREEMCCESTEVHEELLRIVNETLPDETELYDLAELFKYSEIPPESVFFMSYLKLRSVSVTWLRHSI